MAVVLSDRRWIAGLRAIRPDSRTVTRLAVALLVLGAGALRPVRSDAQSVETPQEIWARIEKAIAPDCRRGNPAEGPAAEAVNIPWRNMLVGRKPSRIERSRSLACLDVPLETPIDVSLDCDWAGGFQLVECRPVDSVRADVVRTAIWQSNLYDVRVARASYPPPRFRTRLRIRVDPGDRIDRPTRDVSVPPITMGAVNWSMTPTPDELSKIYPDYAVRIEREGWIAALCQIGDAGRLTCTDAVVGGLPHFFDAVEPIVARFVAAPILKDGSPSAGRWVLMRAAFKLPN